MGNEDYPCVMGMLKENSRYKKNYEFCENKCDPKPQCDWAVWGYLNRTAGIKRTMNFVRINVILTLNVTGLSPSDETDKGKL